MKFGSITQYIMASSVFILLHACGGADEKKESAVDKKVDTVVSVPEKKEEQPARRPPIINIIDTVADKQTLICMKDSAATFERIAMKLGEVYGFKLGAVIKKNNLKLTGRPTAWYLTKKAPWFFEAGVGVDKKPSKIPSNVFVRQMGSDSVIIARFYGPYDLLPQAYEVLNDMLKSRKKKLNGKPYEVYVGDPIDQDGKPVDPYKVRTDVVYPIK